MNGLRLNIAVDDDGKSFYVLDIKVRKKIVADGITDPGLIWQTRAGMSMQKRFNQLSSQSGNRCDRYAESL
jgi:UPF0176 protein